MTKDPTSRQMETLASLPVDSDGMMSLGDVARQVLQQQAQYVSYYLTGIAGYPKLGDGLRIQSDGFNYHSNRIHKDDAAEFVRRVLNSR